MQEQEGREPGKDIGDFKRARSGNILISNRLATEIVFKSSQDTRSYAVQWDSVGRKCDRLLNCTCTV